MISLPRMLEKFFDETLALGISLTLAMLGGFFFLQESQWLDWRLQWRAYEHASEQIAIVAINRPLAHDLAGHAITPRDTLTHLLHKVAASQPAVIGLDFAFNYEEEKNDPAFIELERAMLSTSNLVLPVQLRATLQGHALGHTPSAPLQEKAAMGFANFFHTSSYPAVRGFKLSAKLEDGQNLPAFALTVVGKFFQPDQQEVDWQAVLKQIHYPAASEEVSPLNYFGPLEARCPSEPNGPCARVFKFQDVLNKDFPSTWLTGKIVLIGATFLPSENTARFEDTFDTPFGAMRGVAVHANLVNNLLTQKYIKPAGAASTLAITLLAISLAGFTIWRCRTKTAFLLTFSVLLLYLILGFILFQTHLLLLPLAWPLKAGVLSFMLALFVREQWRRHREARQYLDFEILLEEAASSAHYRLRVIASPALAGDAKAEMTFADWPTFKSDCQLFAKGQAGKDAIQAFGNRLYQHLFVDEIKDCYERSLTQARLQKHGLRLRLRLDAPELRVVPWEFLYDPNHKFFFAQNPEILLTRYVESVQPRRELEVNELNVLLVLSNPEPVSLGRMGMAELQALKEKELIVSALEELRDRVAIPIHWTVLEHAVVAEVRDKLREGYQIFHFIGHGTFRENRGFLVAENEQHEAQLLDEEIFSSLFLGGTEMRLVFLNSCKSATAAALPGLNGLAYQLLQRGIPAVVGMQYSIADQSAQLFAKEFYRTLAGGHPVDFAVAQGRLALAQEVGADKIDFGIPALFMRSKDGRIL